MHNRMLWHDTRSSQPSRQIVRQSLYAVLLIVACATVRPAGAQSPAPSGADAPAFLESVYCAVCHANSSRAVAMRDAQDRGVAPYDLWRGTAMANAARDPFWRAVLSAEVAATPSRKELIEEKCTRCHAPMAGRPPLSPPGQVLAYLAAEDARSWLGMDGVSCTVCHQIRDVDLGTEASFTGHFRIEQKGPIYGPHADPFPMPMLHHTGYTPTLSKHVLRSALCATCHTLDTDALRPDGSATGERLHEQSPYREWRNSVYNDERSELSSEARSCQACHLPTTDVDGNLIAARIAHNPGGRDFPFLRNRSPFGRHTLYGGNTFLTNLLRANHAALDVQAPESMLSDRLRTARTFLQTDAARLTIGTVSRTPTTLQIPVVVENLAGHKLPTAYPSRRVWLRVQVHTADGQLVFASGQFDEQGRLVDQLGHRLSAESAGGPITSHYQKIRSSNEVQIYQSVMADTDGQITFTLLRGASYAKDNRLLPRGWQPTHADGPATAPIGTQGDDDFVGGRDAVVYEVPLAGHGPFTIQAWLHYQALSPRLADELLQFDTPEVRAFDKLYRSTDHPPETLATAQKSVPST